MNRFVVILSLVVAFTCAAQLRIPIGGALQVDSNILDLFKGKKVAYLTCAGDDPQGDAKQYEQFFAKRQIEAK
jgi:hypothetical protein